MFNSSLFRLVNRKEMGLVLLILILILSLPISASAVQGGKGVPKKEGRLRVIYDEAPSEDHEDFQEALKKERVFETIADELNKDFRLPHDVTIMVGDCGVENAFYNPDEYALVLCYELVDEIVDRLAPIAQSEEELLKASSDTTFFIFFHELGHALVHVLDLPITGREEDAVDDLSVLLLLEAGKDGEEAVLNAATWFLMQGKAIKKLKQLAFWDEHGLDLQRFYNIVCLVYGKDSETYASLLANKILPAERAVRCPSEYQQKKKSWEKLLAPYKKAPKSVRR